MNKRTKYARRGAAALFLFGAGRNAFKQLSRSQPGKKFDFGDLLLEALTWGAGGYGGGYAVGAAVDYYNDKEQLIDTNHILGQHIKKLRLTKNDLLYRALDQKASWLIKKLMDKFGHKIKKAPYKFGSTENGTALREDFDIDMCVECLPDAFSSTEEMSSSFTDFLKGLVGINGIVKVRRQTVSIGVFFKVGGLTLRIDVLPKKLTRTSHKDSSGYIFVNKTGLFDKPTRKKTNVALLKNIRLSEPQQQILVSLKRIKILNDLPVSSHLLQTFILCAYAAYRGEIPVGPTDKLILVLRYIADNIEGACIRGIENTNNILTNIPQADKSRIKAKCQEIVRDYEYQPNSIIKHFDIDL